jgi:hypothetical protein
MEVDGSGSINAPGGGQATFHLSASHGKKNKIVGSFSYSDTGAGLTINASKLSSLFISGNQAQITGTGRIGSGKHKQKVTFTVNVVDNGDPGTNDTFSLSVSNGYFASGNLTDGNISIHN